MGASNAGRVNENCDLGQYLAQSRVVNASAASAIHSAATGRGKLMI